MNQRNFKLTEKCSNLERTKVVQGSDIQSLRSENIQLMDELTWEVSHHKRSRDIFLRDCENEYEKLKLEQNHILDKLEHEHRLELASINGSIEDHKDEIKSLKNVVKLKENEISDEKTLHARETWKKTNDICNEFDNRITELELQNHEQITEEYMKLKDAQAALYSLEYKCNKEKRQYMEELDQKKNDNAKYYNEIIETQNNESKKSKQEMENIMKINETRFNNMFNVLKIEKERNTKQSKTNASNLIAELKINHDKIITRLKCDLDGANDLIEKQIRENEAQKLLHKKQMKVALSDLEKSLIVTVQLDKDSEKQKIKEYNDYDLQMNREKTINHLQKLKFDAILEKERATREEIKCNKIGNYLL